MSDGEEGCGCRGGVCVRVYIYIKGVVVAVCAWRKMSNQVRRHAYEPGTAPRAAEPTRGWRKPVHVMCVCVCVLKGIAWHNVIMMVCPPWQSCHAAYAASNEGPHAA